MAIQAIRNEHKEEVVSMTMTAPMAVGIQQAITDGAIPSCLDAPTPPLVVKATPEEVAQFIATESGCSIRVARGLLDMLRRAVKHVRDHPGCVYHVQQTELRRYHAAMDRIMPDDKADPAPGSAHAAINRLLCKGDEVTVVHTRDRSRGVVYCAVAIQVRSI